MSERAVKTSTRRMRPIMSSPSIGFLLRARNINKRQPEATNYGRTYLNAGIESLTSMSEMSSVW